MNKFYKLSTTAGSIAAILGPVAAVISCSNSAINPAKILQIGIRPETKVLFDKIKTEWEKGNPGYKLQFREITNDIGINGSLDSWKAAGSIPEIMVMDTAWASIYAKKHWFQAMDLKDIATNSKFKIDNSLVGEEFKEKDITKADFSTEFSTMINDSKEGSLWNHFATGVGPQVGYMWSKAKDKDGNIIDLFDGTKNLDWFVPNNDVAAQKNIEKVTFNSGQGNSPLFKPGTTNRYKNTLEDIKEFITNSARKDQIKFNGNLDNAQSINNVMSTGYYGQTQRFLSVLLSLKEAFSLNSIPMDGEFWLSFMGLLQGESGLTQSGKSNADPTTGGLDDGAVFSSVDSRGTSDYKINLKTKPKDFSHLSKLEKQMWYGQLGYYQDGAIEIPKAIDSQFSGQGDGMASGKTMSIGSGGGWMYTWKFGYSRPKEEQAKGVKDFQLSSVTTIPLPFEFAGTEGFALKAGLDDNKLNLSKKFMRFLMQPHVQVILNGSSTMATRISALKKQDYPKGLDPIKQSGNLIPKIANDTNHQTYMDIIYNTGKKSTLKKYEQYNESFYKNVAWKAKSLLSNPGTHFDQSSYVSIIGNAIDNYKERIAQG